MHTDTPMNDTRPAPTPAKTAEINLRTVEDTVTQHLILQPADISTLESLLPPALSDHFWANLPNLRVLRSFLAQTGETSNPEELYSLIPTVKLFGPHVTWLQTVIGGLMHEPRQPLSRPAFVAYVRVLLEGVKNLHSRRLLKDCVDDLDSLNRSDIRQTDSYLLKLREDLLTLMTAASHASTLPNMRSHVNKLNAGRIITTDTLAVVNRIKGGGYRAGKATMEVFPSGEGKTSRTLHHGRTIVLRGMERTEDRPELPDLRGMIVETEMPTQEMAHCIMCGTFGIPLRVIQMVAAINILRSDPSNSSVDCLEAALRLSQIDSRFSHVPAEARAVLETTLPTGLTEADIESVNRATDIMDRYLIIVPQPRNDKECMQWVRQAVEDLGVEIVILDHINGIHSEDSRLEEWKFLDQFTEHIVEYCLGQRVELTYMAQPTDAQIALWRQGKYQSFVDTTGSKRLGHHARTIIAGHRDTEDKSRRVTLLTEIKSTNPEKVLRAPVRYVPERFHYVDVDHGDV